MRISKTNVRIFKIIVVRMSEVTVVRIPSMNVVKISTVSVKVRKRSENAQGKMSTVNTAKNPCKMLLEYPR